MAFEIASLRVSHAAFPSRLQTALDLAAYGADLSQELDWIRSSWEAFQDSEVAHVSELVAYNSLRDRLEAFRSEAVRCLQGLAGPNVVAPDFVSGRKESR